MRFSSWIEAGGGGRGGPGEEERAMKGREKRAGRPAMPPWLRCLHHRALCERGGASLAAPQQPKGGGGEAPLPLGLTGFCSYSFLKAICGSLATPSSQEELCSSTAGSSGLPLALEWAVSAKLAGAIPKGLAQPGRQQSQRAPSGAAPIEPNAGGLHDPTPARG